MSTSVIVVSLNRVHSVQYHFHWPYQDSGFYHAHSSSRFGWNLGLQSTSYSGSRRIKKNMLDQWLRGTAHYGLVSFPDPIARRWALILGMRLAGHVYMALHSRMAVFVFLCNNFSSAVEQRYRPRITISIGQGLNGGRRPHGSRYSVTHRASLQHISLYWMVMVY